MAVVVIVSVTTLGSSHGTREAAAGVVAYLQGRTVTSAPGSPPVTDPGTGLGRYYADAVEGPGVWVGSGVGPAWRSGTVTSAELERLLLGQDPTSGEQLLQSWVAQRHHGDTTGPNPDHPSATMTLREAAQRLDVDVTWLQRCAKTSRDWDAVSALTGGTGVPSRPTSYLSTVDGLDTDHPRRPYRVTVEELAHFDQARRGQRATIGFDVTFSAPKSVSVLWAVADPGVEAEILDSIHAAVQAGMRYLEQQAIACRIRATVTQGDGLLAAGYLHATNRNLDPSSTGMWWWPT